MVKNSDNVQLLERMNIISKNPTYFTSLQDNGEEKQTFVREIPLEYLKLVDIVGEGAFGQVFKGTQLLLTCIGQDMLFVSLKHDYNHHS